MVVVQGGVWRLSATQSGGEEVESQRGSDEEEEAAARTRSSLHRMRSRDSGSYCHWPLCAGLYCLLFMGATRPVAASLLLAVRMPVRILSPPCCCCLRYWSQWRTGEASAE